MAIVPITKNLLDMVNSARSGEIALPEFQRNFVWSRDDVRDLLTSVLKGYFIGSFLLLEIDSETPTQARDMHASSTTDTMQSRVFRPYGAPLEVWVCV